MGEELSLSKVVEMLLDMRTYRMGLIQTEDQLRFSVDAIVQGVKQIGLEQKKEDAEKQVNGKRVAVNEVGEGDETDNHGGAKKRKNTDS